MAGLLTNTTAAGLKGNNRKLVGSYIIQVDYTPVYNQSDIEEALCICLYLSIYHKTLSVTLTSNTTIIWMAFLKSK